MYAYIYIHIYRIHRSKESCSCFLKRGYHSLRLPDLEIEGCSLRTPICTTRRAKILANVHAHLPRFLRSPVFPSLSFAIIHFIIRNCINYYKKEARKKEVKKECILELFQDKLTKNDEKIVISKSSLQ